MLGEPLRALASLVCSRRAIRSISHFSPAGFRGWFRYYPSRWRGFAALNMNAEGIRKAQYEIKTKYRLKSLKSV
jgi:hypothetical protein